MTNDSSEPKPVGDLSHRTLKKIGEIDPQSLEPNNKKEMDLRVGKNKSLKDGKYIWIAPPVI